MSSVINWNDDGYIEMNPIILKQEPLTVAIIDKNIKSKKNSNSKIASEKLMTLKEIKDK
jgi:hypothetical protein